MKKVIAVDLGASSGRVIGVSLEQGRLEMHEIYRFPNEGIYAGVQDVWYNTVYQVLGLLERNADRFQYAESFLMISDILGYFLTGSRSVEYTGAATTQLYCLQKKCWSERLLDGIGLKSSIFPTRALPLEG